MLNCKKIEKRRENLPTLGACRNSGYLCVKSGETFCHKKRMSQAKRMVLREYRAFLKDYSDLLRD